MIMSQTLRKTADLTQRILVVDDDHGTREMLRRMLDRHTYAEVHLAPDGPTALSLYASVNPQITLLDIEMPGVDGFGVLEEIRALNPEAFVVMVSAHSRIDAVQRAMRLGIGGYVVKPYSTRRLLDALRRYVNKANAGLLLRPAE